MAVKNEKQFRAWLDGQSREICTAIAVRAALRVVPLVCSIRTDSERQKKLALLTFRAILTSGVAAVGPTPDVRAAAGAAAGAAGAAAGAAGAAARAADAAAYADTKLPAEPRRMLEFSVQGLQAITDAAEELRKQDGRIWVLTAGGDWEFWGHWYERAMAGEARDWELYERIVTEIPDEVWTGENAVAEVARAIARFEAEFKGSKKGLTEPVAPPGEFSSKGEALGTSARNVVAAQVSANRDSIALVSASLIEQTIGLRERIRGNNALSTDFKKDAITFLDSIESHLSLLLEALPENDETISDEKAGWLATWRSSFLCALKASASAYAAPENVAKAIVPTSIILSCTGIGTMMGAPLPGTAVGALITGQLNPHKAATDILKPLGADEE
ncbi:hypothetical protein [Pseudooceanicola marinus]|uniref:hypothetical protein n=1 Tax=Pseudooceanicola marinus TaxID=396013 RepID=UPI001CD5A51F|nr:hypothetical protein [Pseudooceanicola marinus]MCA1336462.1 hypothetical protein [Pseudooceanicola marinus]